MRSTKIVATIGPASREPDVLTAMIEAGMDVARLNFAHGTPAQHAETAGRVRAAAERAGREVAILGDLPGPKLRLGTFAAGRVRNVVFHPSGKYAFVLSVNRSKEASVSSYTVGSDGAIGHIKTAAIGGTTDCMAVDPRGEFLYVCSSAFPETAVSTFRIDSRGSLAEVRASPRVP